MRILPRLKYAITIMSAFLLTALIMTKSTQTPETFASRGDSSILSSNVSQSHKISNPAAVYCTDMGYEYHVTSDGAGGQTDSCTMPDGVVCSAWDFLEGKCGQIYSYCGKIGLDVRTATDGKDPFSREYAVCVDLTGKIIGSVTTLDNLSTKLNHCGSTSEPLVIDSSKPLDNLVGTPPSSWDWRTATFNSIAGNWTSPVKNQGNCGSCWAFAAVGQTEAILNLAAGDPSLDKNLAEEYLVSDCSSAGSCCGGWHSTALNFIKNQGIPDEACLPYVSGSCGCSGSCTCTYSSGGCANTTCSQRCSDYNSRLSYLDSYGSVSSNQTAIKQALITYGPLSVAIDVAEGDNYWDGGVFKCSSPLGVDHAVVIVGYDDAGGYWIVKNSWGSTWNGDGFFKVGYGQCLIENYVYYAHAASSIVATITPTQTFIPTITPTFTPTPTGSIIPPLPGYFSKTSPANGATNQPSNPTLSWGTSSNAVYYEYCIDTTNDNACTTSWISTETNTSVALSSLTPDNYYWHVRARNATGTTYSGNGSTTWRHFTILPAPGYFSKISPANGTTNQPTNPTLSWETSSNAVYYDYCIDTDNDNICTTSWISTGTNTSVGFSGTPGTTYYWHVRAMNATGTTYSGGSSTAWRHFTILPLPGYFTKTSPANGATNQPINPTLSWGASSNADYFEYCIDTTNDNACNATWISTGTTLNVALSDLTPGATYYWHVRARNTTGTTYSGGRSDAWRHFTVLP